MLKVFVFSLFCAVIAAETLLLSNYIDGDVQRIKSKIHFIHSISETRQIFADAYLSPLSRAANVGGNIRYVLGNRIPGDHLVAQGNDSRSWTSLHDVTLNLRYPQSGSGAVVSYVELLVGQSSNIGQAYVVSGGIGQRFVSIVLEAKNTLWFRYNAAFYGY